MAARGAAGALEAARRRARSLHARATPAAVAEERPRQGDPLHAVALGFVHPLPRRRKNCLSNNAAERALRGVAVGRRNWTFAGSDAGGRRAAAIYSLIESCKLNDVDPRAWLDDVLARLPDHPARKIDELMPWAWKAQREAVAKAQTAVAA